MLSACWLIGGHFLAVSSHKRGRLNTSVYSTSDSSISPFSITQYLAVTGMGGGFMLQLKLGSYIIISAPSPKHNNYYNICTIIDTESDAVSTEIGVQTLSSSVVTSEWLHVWVTGACMHDNLNYIIT